MFNLKLITPPADPVVSVDDLKLYLRVDGSLEDLRIQAMEAAAVKKLEDYTSIKFVTQTWDVYLNRWPMSSRSQWWGGVREIALSEIVTPERAITLPIGIAQGVSEFSTYSDDAEFTESLSSYVIDVIGNRVRIGLKLSGVWPTTVLRTVNGIRFRVICGFGDPELVPEDIKMAVKELVAHMYENRGDQNEMKIPAHIFSLVDGYRRQKLGC